MKRQLLLSCIMLATGLSPAQADTFENIQSHRPISWKPGTPYSVKEVGTMWRHVEFRYVAGKGVCSVYSERKNASGVLTGYYAFGYDPANAISLNEEKEHCLQYAQQR